MSHLDMFWISALLSLSLNIASAEVPPNLPGFTGQSAAASTPAQAAPAAQVQKAAPAQQDQSSNQAPTKTGESGAVGEFLIKGEAKMSVDSDKPALSINVDENKALETSLVTEKELYSKNPPMLLEVKEPSASRQASKYVMVPRFIEFRQDAVAHVYHPLAEMKKIYEETDMKRAQQFAHWDFKVADANGRIYFSLTGKGLPPVDTVIKTANERGETIRVGSPYSGVLTYWDSMGNVHTAICESFSMSGLVQKIPKGYVVNLALGSVFSKKGATDISAEGTRLLQETVDWVKSKRGTQSPLGVQVYARNTTLAQTQAEVVTTELVRLLKRSKTSLSGQGKTAATGLDEYVEISLFSAD